MKKLIMILGTVSIAMSAIFVRMSSAPSIVLVFYRMLFAVLILIPMLVIKFREEIKRLKMRDILWCACGGLFLGLHFTVFFESLKYTSIAASVVLVNMEAFIVSITLVLWCGEKIPRKGIFGIAAVFLGTVLIAVSDMGSGSNVVFGDALALLGAFFCIGLYINRKVLQDTYFNIGLYVLCLWLCLSDRVHRDACLRNFFYRLCRDGLRRCLWNDDFLHFFWPQCVQLGVKISQRLLHFDSEVDGVLFLSPFRILNFW